jgi:hypothetical protein
MDSGPRQAARAGMTAEKQKPAVEHGGLVSQARAKPFMP